MDPQTLTAIASTLIKTGPDLIRGIARFFDGDSAKAKKGIANKVANLVDIAAGKPNPEQALNQALISLSPQDLLQLKSVAVECEVQLARIAAERNTSLHQQTQQTIQNGDNSTNPYVSKTRPYMARLSGYIVGTYVLGLEVAAAFDKGSGASLDIALLLISPLLAYMGLREIGKWREGAVTGGASSITTGLSQLFKSKKAGLK
ncbi:hypothetical protein [Shewanella fidelis]|uniref:Uncharacterized protein n=1 Tax=Shewanella fidelis TaxID=173509 RepID=A0AAW8NJI0_9GAMM|nr:hypothetical protein [Shewanella fidelis]MDR8523457.1 hypothetical protein [Shewanella fidelis]MDW4813310.1 hypothetical protein [Shewanella fidelis]MDW4817319.1 hypothetical protein [Shewanella fidelis]MDW4821325.1 hypothetical protein [Shewanella fidelis]MDW4824597.1 hypothetical protein [Shewanella fidelis]